MSSGFSEIFAVRSFIQHSQWRWWPGLIAAILVYGLSTLIATVVVVAVMMGDASEAEIVAGELPAPSGPIILAAAIISQIVIVGALLALARWGVKDWRQQLYLAAVDPGGRWIAALAILAAAFLAGDLMWQSLYGDVLKADGLWIENLLIDPATRWPTLVAVTAGAAFSEEMLFRGFLLPALAKSWLGFSGAAVVSTLLWTLVHGYSWQGAVEVMVLGLMFSYLLWRTGSILPSIALHGSINAAYAAVVLSG